MTISRIDPILAEQAAALTVGGLFSFRARYHGDRPAIEDGERCYSYSQLNERVNRLANALSSQGVRHGDRIAILSENRVEYLELQLAAAKLGAIVAALNWRLTADELRHCIELTTPRAILVSERHLELLATLEHGVDIVLQLGMPYEEMLAQASPSEPHDTAAPEDGLIILYTSGTTGLPKGALISHRAMIARGQSFYLDHAISAEDAFVAWAPLFHMVSTDISLAALVQGGKVIIIDGFDAGRLAKAVQQERIGWLVLMPGMIESFNERLRADQVQPRGIKAIGCMADLVPLHQIAEATTLLQAPFINSFGSSETGSPPATKGVIGIGETPQRLSKVQSSYCQIRLVDDNDQDVPDGEPGELAIRGPTLFSGYWQNPEANASDFRGGWFHLGDMFVRNPDGTLDFVDRRKYLIKSGGENIYPAEIERVLLADERVGDAIVVRRADARWGEVPVAFVVRRDPALTKQNVLKICEGRIARYKMPKEVRFVAESELPRSTTGKIKRHELESTFEQETEDV